MKRQNSWQDGIARIFKSYDSDKTTGDSATTLDNQSTFASEKRDDDPCGDGDLDMSKVFQGCEEEEGASRTSEDTQANVLDNEAGSLSDLPDRLPPLAPTKAPGPSSPVPPSDSFLKRLGSLFHFFTKAEARVPQLEPNSALVSEPGGVACPADGTQQANETSSGQPRADNVGLQRPEMDTAPPDQEQEPSPSHMAAETATEAPCQPTSQATDRLSSVKNNNETAWSQAADQLTSTEDADKAQEQERQQASEGPAVITHSTYRGQREVRKMRRKQQPVQIYSPISEGDESHVSRGSEAGSPVSLPDGLPLHRDSAMELRGDTSEPSDVFPLQEDQPSSQASHVMLTDGQHDACRNTLKDPFNVHQGCQESPSHSVPVPDGRNCEVKDCFLDTNKNLDVQLPGLPVGSAGTPRLPVDEECLQSESKAMVDLILKNALTALEKMETVEQKNDIPCVSDAECEAFTYAGARHAYQKEEYDFQDAAQELDEKHVLATHGDDQGMTRTQGDNSRSTFSSGYESIAGSDTDIRSSPGQSFEGSPLALPTSSLHTESPSMATPGVLDSYEQAPGDSESDFTDCEKYDHESVDGITNTMFEIKDDTDTEELGALTLEREDLYTNSCLANEPEVEDGEIRPKASQNSEQSVDSHCTNQSEFIHADNTCKVIECTELADIQKDSESFSVACMSEEKLQSQEVVRPKPLQIAQQSGGSHEFQGQAVMAPTCWSTTEARPDSGTGVEHEVAFSEEQCLSTALCAGDMLSDEKEGTEDELGVDDRTVDVDLLASAIRVLVSGPQPVPSSRFPTCDNQEEEEEMNAIFVNDTGPTERAAVRRGKSYPFSLSPIFEEEESLQVPPATEEMKSAEQQTCSILSLLQSVSERLQSSAFTDDDPDDPETCTDSMDPFRCSRWGSLSDREDADEEHDLTFPDPILPSLTSLRDETEGPSDVEGTAPQEVSEEKDWVAALSKPKRIISSPYYEYLKSTPPPIPQEESVSEGKPSKPLVKEEQLSLKQIIPRPSVMHIYAGVTFSGEKQVVYGDVVDTGGMTFETGVSIRVLTGCWLLYVEPGFKGSCTVLEEGERVLTSGGTELKGQSTDSPHQLSIGSIRRVVKDDGIPEVHCHREGEAPLVLHSQIENLEAVQTSSVSVKSGCWLAYEERGFDGNFAVLEMGGQTAYGCGPLVSHVRSLRPLLREGPKVSRPLDPKMVLYELPDFQGQCRELETHSARVEDMPRVSSLRVISGIWVGYSRENYRGPQCLLEEGEYRDCRELATGSHHTFLSFRFLLADCLEPAMSLRNAHSPESAPMDIVDLDVPDVERDGRSPAPTSIWVKSGVWVAYSGKCFSGEQYVLEKGHHSCPLDWGDCSGKVLSLRPVRLSCGSRCPKYLIGVYGGPHFSGEHDEYESEVADCSSLHPGSFRVIHGSWVLFDEEGCCGNQFVLSEGLYPDLSSCGSGASAIKSLQPVPYCFSDASITLFSLDSFEGLQTEAVASMDSMNGFFTQSLRVNGGLWVAYEYSHFKGRQMLLQAGEYSRWGEHSGWDTIGSLYALGQPKAYVQVRNRLLGSVLTAEPAQDNDSPAKVSLKAPKALDCQKWIFTDGLLKCKVGKACMSVIGGKAHAGARVALWPEHGRTHQRWSLNANGSLSSHLHRSLVLDIRGGNGIDRDHFIVNEFSAEQPSQLWDIELV